MCGITGIWNFNGSKLDRHKFTAFTDSLTHRGPDSSDYYFDNTLELALGHRRLSILDLTEAGSQPMRYLDTPYIICYNGEVYNYLELRTELQNLGYQFKTGTDTEVVLAAFIEWGEACQSKFNGMWAFMIWNEKTAELFVSRDRFGIKPLFYIQSKGQYLACASETYAFKYLDGFARSFDREILIRSMNHDNFVESSGRTMFNNVMQLLPGHCITVTRNSGEIQQKRWWNTFDNVSSVPKEYKDQVHQFRELLIDSCRLRLRSDVNLATALSGGVDSSSIYCLLHHMSDSGKIEAGTSDSWQEAFIATFPGTLQDEQKYADQVIEFTNGKANYIKPDYSNLANNIVETTRLFDSITGTPIFIVSGIYGAMRQNGYVVSMDGHGVDEMMFGYTPSVRQAFIQAVISGRKEYANVLLDTYVNMLHVSDRDYAMHKARKKAKVISDFEKKMANEMIIKKWLKRFLKRRTDNFFLDRFKTNEWFGEFNCSPVGHISDSPYDFQTMNRAELNQAEAFHRTEIPYNLRDFDRASMQQSIEIRMPFMDYRLVQFVFNLPIESRLNGGYTKRILRDAMKGILPETIRTRKLKIGLSAPLTNWFNGELNEFVSDHVNSRSFQESTYWNGPFIKNLLDEKNGKLTTAECLQLWKIINGHLILT